MEAVLDKYGPSPGVFWAVVCLLFIGAVLLVAELALAWLQAQTAKQRFLKDRFEAQRADLTADRRSHLAAQGADKRRQIDYIPSNIADRSP
ncbi:MAG: hypothetical protein WDM79_02855 [Terricaulis sp.]